MLTRSEIKDYFKLENSHAKKELGQNFLCNQKIVTDIINLLNVDQRDILLEIGPGLGALTDDLIGKTDDFTIVEYDAKFVDFLSRSFANRKIQIIKKNILKYQRYDANKIVGNLPYYITSDILLYVALHFNNLDKAVFMMQKEAFKRINAKKGCKDYNALNIVLDYAFKFTQNSIVSKTSFFPMPHVDSVIVSFNKKNDTKNELIKPLLVCTRAMFLNRRKTLYNNMYSLIKNKETSIKIITDLHFSMNSRAEELTVKDFVNLTNVLLKHQVIKL